MKALKRIRFLLAIFFIVGGIVYGNDLEDLIKNNEFDFDLINKNGSYGGAIYNKYDAWECNSGRDYSYFGFDTRTIFTDKVEIACLSSFFILYGTPAYREYVFPKKTVVTISKAQIEKRINSIKNGNIKKNREIAKNSLSVKAECNGLSIAENVRIREKPEIKSDITILGKLKKFQKVKILDISDNVDEIEGLKSCWCKIKTDNGITGWVFGAFVKIYFLDYDLELLYKAFEK